MDLKKSKKSTGIIRKIKSNAYIIPFSYCDNVKDVFEKYFDKKKPFGIEKKKEEFPDAFIIQSLRSILRKILWIKK